MAWVKVGQYAIQADKVVAVRSYNIAQGNPPGGDQIDIYLEGGHKLEFARDSLEDAKRFVASLGGATA